MSEIKVNKISPRSGTDVTLGDSGDTFTVPSGATIVNSGTATGFGDNLEWQSVVTASTLTAVAGRGYPIDTTSNACTVTLPASASVGDQIIFTDYARNWNTNALTINQNSLKYQGYATPNPVYDTDGESVNIVYMDATNGWIPINDGAVAFETPQTYTVDTLVVAGGGGSIRNNAGGGGGGGMRTSTPTLTGGTVYTLTVGAGGVGLGATTVGNSGGDSTITGSGFSTFTSTGGGGSAGGDATAEDGGAGGGAGYLGAGKGGAGNTPSTTPSQGEDGGEATVGSPNYPGHGGGGGGASGVAGSNGDSTNAGAGGDGTASSITGSSVTYAGGGGGSCEYGGTAGAGGAGGGGAGKNDNQNENGDDGTDGKGGGGGGTYGGSYTGGSGGDGVIILKIADADYSGTTTGSPAVDTSSVTDYTILTYTTTGTYTA